jgi:mono/diheme cytochrome c family protein
MKLYFPAILLFLFFARAQAVELAPPNRPFIEKHCFECHDSDSNQGGLDLTSLKFDAHDPKLFALWVKVHDRVRDGEMPPPKKLAHPAAAAEIKEFLKATGDPLTAADQSREAKEGRSTWRRLNRYEYENTVRDLLQAPWLQVKQMLPEDGESLRFNKIGDALDVSHVQMAQYLAAAEYALRQVMASQATRPEARTVRYYTRDQRSFAGKMKFSVFNQSPERATFPVLGTAPQPDVRAGNKPLTVGAANPAVREQEAMGVVASSYEPIEPRYDAFEAQQPGRYKLRFNAYSIWVGPTKEAQAGKEPRWWVPDLDTVSRGRRKEPITIYSETRPRQLRWMGRFDVTPDPSVHELDVWLLKGESVRPDAARLFRSRPSNWHNPLAEKDGQPGVAFRWLEVEGPIVSEWPTAGQRLMFGDLPLVPVAADKGKTTVEIKPSNPDADAARLLRAFMQRAYRRPVQDTDVHRFLGVIQSAMKEGTSFTDAMIAGYSGVLCSPEFVCLEEKPGRLDDYALSARLAYFIWNSGPDEPLRALAAKGELHRPEVLRAQTERLLNDPRSRRFVDAFLDYWLDLRKINATSPDAGLYPDYYLDDMVVESAQEETQLFFAELLRENLPARNVVASDFVMVNERLAALYGLPPVDGSALRRVALPSDSPRGGLMTQASVLKVTANGTTTSPVLRGVWIMERILGKPSPPPPPGIPAVEPDIRGATTIRQQLDKHRSAASCAACHSKIDPAGFALENFDVMGAWRDRYRANGEGKREVGYGKNGQPFAFHLAQNVDASGELPGGGKFQNIRDLKRLLLADEKQIARNLTQQLVVYATGAAIHFGDRPRIEQILERAEASHYGVRTLVHEIVQSELFQEK